MFECLNRELVDFNVFVGLGMNAQPCRQLNRAIESAESATRGTILICFPVLKSDIFYASHVLSQPRKCFRILTL